MKILSCLVSYEKAHFAPYYRETGKLQFQKYRVQTVDDNIHIAVIPRLLTLETSQFGFRHFRISTIHLSGYFSLATSDHIVKTLRKYPCPYQRIQEAGQNMHGTPRPRAGVTLIDKLRHGHLGSAIKKKKTARILRFFKKFGRETSFFFYLA